jgi:hypothetical protein
MIPISFAVPCPGQKAISPNLTTVNVVKIREEDASRTDYSYDHFVRYQLDCTQIHHGWSFVSAEWDVVTKTINSESGESEVSVHRSCNVIPTPDAFVSYKNYGIEAHHTWYRFSSGATIENIDRIENLVVKFSRPWNNKILRNSNGVILRGANGTLLRDA